jgi:hypothetical protein
MADMRYTVEKTDFPLENEQAAFKAPGTWFIAVCCGLIIAFSGLSMWFICQCVSASLQAESNLHHSHYALQLVERFVIREGRWPRSWAELEGVDMRDGPLGPEWARTFAEMQRRIIIDFGADLQEVARQDRMAFRAIRPNGPRYEYRDYGYVDSLQIAIRKSVSVGQPNSSSRPSN